MSDSSDTSKPTLKQDLQRGAAYKKRDFIGQKYEVYGVLGKGGFGVVYLVYSHEVCEVFALKTFKDEFLADEDVRKRFYKEASVWAELGRYPYLVRAYFVEEISGRLYIGMEYVAPNEDGLNSLDGYLERRPPDLAQSLRWGIQICYGMEYAYSKGVRAHRDLKPANIMITQDKTAKIADFGLAGVISESQSMRTAGLSAQPGRSALPGQTLLGTGFGTPTHMAPEQFDSAAVCDERSDIYSFGIVLYQMAAGGQVPFPVPMDGNFWQAMRQLHRESPVPRLDSALFPIIQRCLEKSPENRYQTFKDVRNDLEPLLQHQTGEVITPPQLKELEAWEWINKGASLGSLGRDEEAVRCLDKALALDPSDVRAWDNKGNILDGIGRHEEAVRCYDEALVLDPRHAVIWYDKGISLDSVGRNEEAVRCYDKSLALDPRDVHAWYNKGISLDSMGRPEDAIRCYDKALEFEPCATFAWNNKGTSLSSLGRYEEAICCYNKALEFDPCHVHAWFGKAWAEEYLGQWQDAAVSYQQCLALALTRDAQLVEYARKRLQELGDKLSRKVSQQDPGVVPIPTPEPEPSDAAAWFKKGNTCHSLGRFEEAARCYDRVLELDQSVVNAWNNKGSSLDSLGRQDEAVRCYDKALELDPRDAAVWYNKGKSLHSLGRYGEAIHCYDKALELDPHYVNAWTNEGASLGSLGRDEEAICCLDKALALEPRDVAAWTNKGASLLRLGRNEEAIRCCDKALELDPHYINAWNNKGNGFNSLGRYRDAISCCEEALKLDQRHVGAWINKGNALGSLGQYEEAIRCYDKALEIDPCQVVAWTNKGDSLRLLGHFEEATLCFDKALELDPRYVYAWFNKALAEDKLGHSMEAVFSYQQFLALDPAQAAKQSEYARKRLRELGG